MKCIYGMAKYQLRYMKLYKCNTVTWWLKPLNRAKFTLGPPRTQCAWPIAALGLEEEKKKVTMASWYGNLPTESPFIDTFAHSPKGSASSRLPRSIFTHLKGAFVFVWQSLECKDGFIMLKAMSRWMNLFHSPHCSQEGEHFSPHPSRRSLSFHNSTEFWH